MNGHIPRGPLGAASFTWRCAMSMVVVAAGGYGSYILRQYHILTEEQLILILFLAVPVAAFVLSGVGQATEDAEVRPQDDQLHW